MRIGNQPLILAVISLALPGCESTPTGSPPAATAGADANSSVDVGPDPTAAAKASIRAYALKICTTASQNAKCAQLLDGKPAAQCADDEVAFLVPAAVSASCAACLVSAYDCLAAVAYSCKCDAAAADGGSGCTVAGDTSKCNSSTACKKKFSPNAPCD